MAYILRKAITKRLPDGEVQKKGEKSEIQIFSGFNVNKSFNRVKSYFWAV